MHIDLENLGKKFKKEWLFQDLNLQFDSGRAYAITGPNGSGKSTLLQLIAGYQLPSLGKIRYHQSDKEVSAENIYKHISVTAPYMELIEEFTLLESLDFHFKFKPIKKGMTIDDIIRIGYFSGAKDKQVRHFSSGMKQRLKLLLTVFSDADIVLMDEPTTNLDEKGIEWYKEQLPQLASKLVILASNQKVEYQFCENIISLDHFKMS